MQTKKISIAPILLTTFIDLFGYGIVIPVLAPLLFDINSGLFPDHYTIHERAVILGFLLASYSVAQFFGAPILGALSDRIGRKIVLVTSLIGTAIGYLLFGWGVLSHNLVILFVGRILDGFTGGNNSTVYSSVADISDEHSKTKNFGLVGMAFGLGFIIGPVIGGKLADSTLVPWFNYATPFWFGAILTVINIIWVATRFPETLKQKLDTKISFLTGFRHIQLAFNMKNLRVMFLIIFILTFGFNLFVQFFSVYLLKKFDLTQSEIGNMFAYVGLCIALSQGLVTRIVSKKFSPHKILPVAILLLAFSFFAISLPNKLIYLFMIAPFVAVAYGLIQPTSTTILSNMTDEKSQGEVMGINQALLSVAQIIPPIVDGFVVSLNIHLPLIFAGLVTLLGWVVFKLFLRVPAKTA